MFKSHLIHWPFASNAMPCMTQQLLLYYQIPQYDRHHFPVTGILLIYTCTTFRSHRYRQLVSLLQQAIKLLKSNLHLFIKTLP